MIDVQVTGLVRTCIEALYQDEVDFIKQLCSPEEPELSAFFNTAMNIMRRKGISLSIEILGCPCCGDYENIVGNWNTISSSASWDQFRVYVLTHFDNRLGYQFAWAYHWGEDNEVKELDNQRKDREILILEAK